MIQPGDILISPPMMRDPRFVKTVIMITSTEGGGHQGLCINKCTEYNLQDLAEEMRLENPPPIPLYWGGPVCPQTVWMLHSLDWQMANTMVIDDRWAVTSHKTMFDCLLSGDHPSQFRIMFGCCGWARDQLDMELGGQGPWKKETSWLTWTNPDCEDLLEIPSEDLWETTTEACSQQAIDNWL